MSLWSRSIRIAWFLAACGAVVGCTSSPPPQVEGMSYADRPNHFAVNLFPSWERLETKGLPADKKDVAVFVRALPDGAGQAVINVVVDTAAGATDLQEYLRGNRELFSCRAVGYDELRATVVDHPSGRKACLIEATFERIERGSGEATAPQASRPKKRFMQYALLYEGKQFVITATGPAAEAEALWLNEATAILDSLVIW
ncbi:MAG: hypothetical protein JXL80_15505 [Planctomycetes bacterium]|nr:hypothetical protein [Planctomycetota bacterium]